MITIDYKDRRPIYQQLITNIENMAINGILPVDSQLPSVRSLAMELSINPNTIQRAYQELEKKGLIYSVQGKGSFIAKASSDLLNQKIESFWSELKEKVFQAYCLHIKEEDFVDKSKKFYCLAKDEIKEAKSK